VINASAPAALASFTAGGANLQASLSRESPAATRPIRVATRASRASCLSPPQPNSCHP